MAMGIYSRFYFRPARGEQVNTSLSPETDRTASLCGRVTDGRGGAVEGAVALLFLPSENGPPTLLDRTVTDADGHFIFGPLEGETLYLVKLYKGGLRLRTLEIETEA